MKEQKYIIKGDLLNIKQTLECGQCFRWNKQKDKSYIGVIKNGVIKIEENNKDIIITGKVDGEIKEIIDHYFDLNRDYDKIKRKLEKIDDNMKTAIEYGSGIRLLNQDLWEMIISYIISANNNIPRIKGIIEKMSEKYGECIEWNGNKYYTFPTVEELSKANVQELRGLGLGFRDIRVYETTKLILNKEIDISKLEKMQSKQLKEELLKLSGVGPKVADCIMLFSDLKRIEVFPIDVWVRRVMNELYIHEKDESKVNKTQLEKLAKNKYGDLAGIAQQYLFYWRREIDKN